MYFLCLNGDKNSIRIGGNKYDKALTQMGIQNIGLIHNSIIKQIKCNKMY